MPARGPPGRSGAGPEHGGRAVERAAPLLLRREDAELLALDSEVEHLDQDVKGDHDRGPQRVGVQEGRLGDGVPSSADLRLSPGSRGL